MPIIVNRSEFFIELIESNRERDIEYNGWLNFDNPNQLIAALSKNTALTTLSFKALSVQNGLMSSIIQAANPTLQTLVFLNCCHRETIIEVAVALENNLHIKILDLSGSKIDDECANVIAKLIERNTSLKEINLDDIEISEVGLNAIVKALFNNTTITCLSEKNHNNFPYYIITKKDDNSEAKAQRSDENINKILRRNKLIRQYNENEHLLEAEKIRDTILSLSAVTAEEELSKNNIEAILNLKALAHLPFENSRQVELLFLKLSPTLDYLLEAELIESHYDEIVKIFYSPSKWCPYDFLKKIDQLDSELINRSDIKLLPKVFTLLAKAKRAPQHIMNAMRQRDLNHWMTLIGRPNLFILTLKLITAGEKGILLALEILGKTKLFVHESGCEFISNEYSLRVLLILLNIDPNCILNLLSMELNIEPKPINNLLSALKALGEVDAAGTSGWAMLASGNPEVLQHFLLVLDTNLAIKKDLAFTEDRAAQKNLSELISVDDFSVIVTAIDALQNSQGEKRGTTNTQQLLFLGRYMYEILPTLELKAKNDPECRKYATLLACINASQSLKNRTVNYILSLKKHSPQEYRYAVVAACASNDSTVAQQGSKSLELFHPNMRAKRLQLYLKNADNYDLLSTAYQEIIKQKEETTTIVAEKLETAPLTLSKDTAEKHRRQLIEDYNSKLANKRYDDLAEIMEKLRKAKDESDEVERRYYQNAIKILSLKTILYTSLTKHKEKFTSIIKYLLAANLTDTDHDDILAVFFPISSNKAYSQLMKISVNCPEAITHVFRLLAKIKHAPQYMHDRMSKLNSQGHTHWFMLALNHLDIFISMLKMIIMSENNLVLALEILGKKEPQGETPLWQYIHNMSNVSLLLTLLNIDSTQPTNIPAALEMLGKKDSSGVSGWAILAKSNPVLLQEFLTFLSDSFSSKKNLSTAEDRSKQNSFCSLVSLSDFNLIFKAMKVLRAKEAQQGNTTKTTNGDLLLEEYQKMEELKKVTYPFMAPTTFLSNKSAIENKNEITLPVQIFDESKKNKEETISDIKTLALPAATIASDNAAIVQKTTTDKDQLSIHNTLSVSPSFFGNIKELVRKAGNLVLDKDPKIEIRQDTQQYLNSLQ